MDFSYTVLFLDENQQLCLSTLFIYRGMDSSNRRVCSYIHHTGNGKHRRFINYELRHQVDVKTSVGDAKIRIYLHTKGPLKSSRFY
jgi:hypothetical protein